MERTNASVQEDLILEQLVTTAEEQRTAISLTCTSKYTGHQPNSWCYNRQYLISHDFITDAHTYCKDNDCKHGEHHLTFCVTARGRDNGFPEGFHYGSDSPELWVYFCNDGEPELVEDPYVAPGKCTTEGFIEDRKHSMIGTDPERFLGAEDVIPSHTSTPGTDPTKRCAIFTP